MIRALIGSLCVAILALSIIAICLWGWGQKNANNALQSDRSLEVERGVSSDLRVSLEAAQTSNSKLLEQLQYERDLVQKYQVKVKDMDRNFLETVEKIRILESEDKEFSVWSNTRLPFGIVGLLNSPGETSTNHSNKN